MALFKVRLNEELHEIEATRLGDQLRVTFAGKTIELKLLHVDGPTFVLERELPDGKCQRIRATGHVDGDQRQIWVNGRAFTYERVRQQNLPPSDDRSHSLSAAIPAVVSEILVDIGDEVTVGDKLILLESMKMVIPIQAPCSGRVSAINCAVGEAVQPGIQLVEIDAGEE